jgi:hypothetical protein
MLNVNSGSIYLMLDAESEVRMDLGHYDILSLNVTSIRINFTL